tara:strand:- start:156 stop:899 length:744 start_codon:yes stop_codon:yes gene_type:complete
MVLLEKIKNKIKIHALKESPKECCGFILLVGDQTELYQCTNFSTTPSSHFSISPKDYIKASDKGKIIAVYHSHPLGSEKFSPSDLMNSSGHNTPFVVYSITKDCFSIHDPLKDKSYIESKPFEFGVSDCYNFVIQYYKELGIDLLDHPKKRNSNWEKEAPDLANQIIKLNKNLLDKTIMQRVGNEENLKEHDILLFKMIEGKKINHAAVYLGNNKIIHRPRNKNITIENLSPSRKSKISKIYRACQT